MVDSCGADDDDDDDDDGEDGYLILQMN